MTERSIPGGQLKLYWLPYERNESAIVLFGTSAIRPLLVDPNARRRESLACWKPPARCCTKPPRSCPWLRRTLNVLLWPAGTGPSSTMRLAITSRRVFNGLSRLLFTVTDQPWPSGVTVKVNGSGDACHQ